AVPAEFVGHSAPPLQQTAAVMPGRGGLRHHANVRMVGGTVEELASSVPRLACLVLRKSAKAEPRKWGCLHFLSGSLAEVAARSKNCSSTGGESAARLRRPA